MDPLLMAGAWAAAALSLLAFGRVLYHAFIKAVKIAIRQELERVWTDQDQIEQRLTALETSLHYIKQQVDSLTLMMQQHVGGDNQ